MPTLPSHLRRLDTGHVNVLTLTVQKCELLTFLSSPPPLLSPQREVAECRSPVRGCCDKYLPTENSVRLCTFLCHSFLALFQCLWRPLASAVFCLFGRSKKETLSYRLLLGFSLGGSLRSPGAPLLNFVQQVRPLPFLLGSPPLRHFPGDKLHAFRNHFANGSGVS